MRTTRPLNTLAHALSGLLLCCVLCCAPALATPPDMVCASMDGAAGFHIQLMTGSSGLNVHGIKPLSIYHSRIELPPGVIKNGPASVPVYSDENLKGQWLRDGRVDLHLYKETRQPGNAVHSLELVIRTRSTGQRDKDSGHLIHRGSYILSLFSGSLQGRTEKLPQHIRGKAECR